MSNEIKTLRALLAEARRVTDYVGCQPTPEANREADDICKRIDAALQEPSVDWRKAHADALSELSKATEELDEARAEVERLKADATQHEKQLGSADDTWIKYGKALAEIERLKNDTTAAYQRGAEAMREAAAKACAGVRSGAAVDHYIWVGCREGCVEEILALPIPEDK